MRRSALKHGFKSGSKSVRRPFYRLLGLTLAIALPLALIASPAPAVILQPMTVAYSGVVSGNLSTAGNSVLTCSTSAGTNASSCLAARSRSATRLNNDDYQMVNIKAPFAGVSSNSYFNASGGSIVVPAGASIIHATLFWGGSMRINSGDTPAVDPSAKGQVLFARSGDDCSTTDCAVTATAADIHQLNPTTNLGPYRASADITNKLNQPGLGWVTNGPHQSLTVSVANIQTTLGRDKAAGWGVIVVYQDSNTSPHHIRILKGMAQEAIIEDDIFQFDGFQTANTGNVLSEVALVSFDGDASSASDSISIVDGRGSALVADRANPDNNIANSTISLAGIITPYLNNSSVDRASNTFGVDVDRISLVNGLSRDVTSAHLQPSIGGDVIYVTGVALSVEITSPDIQLTKYVSAISGGATSTVETGDTVEYTITATNNGQANASNLVIRDDLGADLTLVSASGTDCPSVPAGDVCKSIGALNAGDSTSMTFTATVTGASLSTTGKFDNLATATFDGPLGSQSAQSEIVTLAYGATGIDLTSQVGFNSDYVQAGKSSTITASVVNLGPSSDSNPSLELVAQDGALLTVSQVPAGCVKTGTTTMLCNATALGISNSTPLAPGAKASVTFTVTPSKTATSFKVWATAKTGHSIADSNSSNDTAETMLYVNHKPKAKITKANAKAGGKPIQIKMATKISDSDGDTLRITLGKVKYGKAVVNGDVITYTPPKKWTGTFKIRYTVNDGKGGRAKSWIVIKVSKSGGSSGGQYCFIAGC
jgi:uncharacterized repeat protein (TIGR01451 family)